MPRPLVSGQGAVPRGRPTRTQAAATAVPARDILGNHEVRAYCAKRLGKRTVTRATLIRWRNRRGFPEPFRTLHGSRELWDRRTVRAWLTTHADALYHAHTL